MTERASESGNAEKGLVEFSVYIHAIGIKRVLKTIEEIKSDILKNVQNPMNKGLRLSYENLEANLLALEKIGKKLKKKTSKIKSVKSAEKRKKIALQLESDIHLFYDMAKVQQGNYTQLTA